MTIIVKNKDTLFFDDFEFKCCVGKKGFAKKGDMVINLASMPVKESGMVNTLKISEIK